MALGYMDSLMIPRSMGIATRLAVTSYPGTLSFPGTIIARQYRPDSYLPPAASRKGAENMDVAAILASKDYSDPGRITRVANVLTRCPDGESTKILFIKAMAWLNEASKATPSIAPALPSILDAVRNPRTMRQHGSNLLSLVARAWDASATRHNDNVVNTLLEVPKLYLVIDMLSNLPPERLHNVVMPLLKSAAEGMTGKKPNKLVQQRAQKLLENWAENGTQVAEKQRQDIGQELLAIVHSGEATMDLDVIAANADKARKKLALRFRDPNAIVAAADLLAGRISIPHFRTILLALVDAVKEGADISAVLPGIFPSVLDSSNMTYLVNWKTKDNELTALFKAGLAAPASRAKALELIRKTLRETRHMERRLTALELMGIPHDPEGIELMVPFIVEDDRQLQRQALVSLLRALEEKPAVVGPILQKAVFKRIQNPNMDEYGQLREAEHLTRNYVEFMGRISEIVPLSMSAKDILRHIVDLTQQPRSNERVKALEAMLFGAADKAPITEALLKMLAEKDPFGRRYAARQLGRMRATDVSLGERFIDMASSPSIDLRYGVGLIYGNLGPDVPITDAEQQMLRMLAVKDREKTVRDNANWAMDKLGMKTSG